MWLKNAIITIIQMQLGRKCWCKYIVWGVPCGGVVVSFCLAFFFLHIISSVSLLHVSRVYCSLVTENAIKIGKNPNRNKYHCQSLRFYPSLSKKKPLKFLLIMPVKPIKAFHIFRGMAMLWILFLVVFSWFRCTGANWSLLNKFMKFHCLDIL